MKNLLLSRVLLVASMLGIMTSAFAFSGGTGTEADPYLVGTVAELQEIRTVAAASYVKLTADIDFTGEAAQTPFDNDGTNFKVNLDGDGYKIMNMTITGQGFATKMITSTIKNICFDNVAVNSDASFGTGIIAGFSFDNNNKIQSCSVINSTVIAATDGTKGQAVGAVIGAAMGATCYIEDCYTDNVTVSGRTGVGAVVGRLNAHMARCAAYGGTITSTDKLTEQVKGNGTIVPGDAFVGPLVGDTWDEATFSIENCYYSNSGFTYNAAGAVITDFVSTRDDGTTLLGIGLDDLTVEADYVGFDFVTNWEMNANYPTLQVSVSAPVVEELVKVHTDKHNGNNTPVGGYYMPGDSITLSITYNANSDAQLSLVFKTKESDFKTLVMPKMLITLPNTDEESTYEYKIAIPDTATAMGDVRISAYLGTWVAGNDIFEYIIISNEEVVGKYVTSIETEKHDGEVDVIGGYYLLGDTMTLSVTYSSPDSAELSIALKVKDGGYTTDALPKRVIQLVPTTQDTTINIEYIVDSAAIGDTCRFSAWIDTWVKENEKYEYIFIGEQTTALNNVEAIAFKVYPNPTQGTVTVSLENAAEIMVSDLSGKMVLRQVAQVGINSIDMSSCNAGIYFVTVKEDGKQSTMKLMVR